MGPLPRYKVYDLLMVYSWRILCTWVRWSTCGAKILHTVWHREWL